jgi:DNA-binding MarR family transcriptional regulator
MSQRAITDPCHCHVVRKAARYVTGFYDEALAPAGLRLAQFSMLVTLSGADELALGELAGALGLDRTTATRNLKLLERAGYVAIGASEADGRRKAIRLTETGWTVLRGAVPLWEAAQAAFEARHGAALVGQVHDVLGALDKNRPESRSAGRKTAVGD